MFFFILLNIILLFFCLYFYFEQKKLKQTIKNLEEETKIIIERKISYSKEDLISIENLSIESNDEKIKEKNYNDIDNDIIEKSKEAFISKSNNKKYNARAPIDEYQIPKIAKPTSANLIENTKTTKENNNYIKENVSLTPKFDPLDFIKVETLKKDIIESKEKDEFEYLEEVSKQISEQINYPQTIELTDYEKTQEEQAVISYKELLSLKEKLKNEEEKDTKFLDDLRELRKLLD